MKCPAHSTFCTCGKAEEMEKLRAENEKLKSLLSEVEDMGCVYKANMTGCPGCHVTNVLAPKPRGEK